MNMALLSYTWSVVSEQSSQSTVQEKRGEMILTLTLERRCSLLGEPHQRSCQWSPANEHQPPLWVLCHSTWQGREGHSAGNAVAMWAAHWPWASWVQTPLRGSAPKTRCCSRESACQTPTHTVFCVVIAPSPRNPCAPGDGATHKTTCQDRG